MQHVNQQHKRAIRAVLVNLFTHHDTVAIQTRALANTIAAAIGPVEEAFANLLLRNLRDAFDEIRAESDSDEGLRSFAVDDTEASLHTEVDLNTDASVVELVDAPAVQLGDAHGTDDDGDNDDEDGEEGGDDDEGMDHGDDDEGEDHGEGEDHTAGSIKTHDDDSSIAGDTYDIELAAAVVEAIDLPKWSEPTDYTPFNLKEPPHSKQLNNATFLRKLLGITREDWRAACKAADDLDTETEIKGRDLKTLRKRTNMLLVTLHDKAQEGNNIVRGFLRKVFWAPNGRRLKTELSVRLIRGIMVARREMVMRRRA